MEVSATVEAALLPVGLEEPSPSQSVKIKLHSKQKVFPNNEFLFFCSLIFCVESYFLFSS